MKVKGSLTGLDTGSVYKQRSNEGANGPYA